MSNAKSTKLGRVMTDTEQAFFSDVTAYTKSVLWLYVGDNGQVSAIALAEELRAIFDVDSRMTELVKLVSEIVDTCAREWAQGKRSAGSVKMLKEYKPEIVLG